ncbi:hypothetical protein AB0M20_36830, partial [Actinoplanes sp. NPDC051633]
MSLDEERHEMRTRSLGPVLVAVVTLTLAGACESADEPTVAESVAPATTSCATAGDITMWERSGGNKQMVDLLVAAWNT